MAEKVDRQCLRCGAVFPSTAAAVERGRGKYCSSDCQRSAARDERWHRHHTDLSWVVEMVDMAGAPVAMRPTTARAGLAALAAEIEGEE